jgi:hypothetical protein
MQKCASDLYFNVVTDVYNYIKEGLVNQEGGEEIVLFSIFSSFLIMSSTGR